MAEETWGSLLQNVSSIEATDVKESLKSTLNLVSWYRVDKWITLVRKCRFLFNFNWALFPVLRLLGYANDKLTECNQFPYKKDNINNWFVHEVTIAGERDKHRVTIMNVDESGKRNKCYAIQNNFGNFPSDLEDGNFEVFFHGTNYAGAKSIIENGIAKVKGGRMRDFSSGDGFYLDTDLDRALEWANDKSSSPAVLIWRVERSEFRERYRSLDFRMERTAGPQFQTVVSNFRSGQPDTKLRKELDKNYDYIEGPWSAGPWPDDGRVSKGRATPLDDTYQLCLKNDRCIQVFNTRKLHSAVFF